MLWLTTQKERMKSGELSAVMAELDAHRSVIQKRLKLSGAWWTTSNAQAMLNLRCLRANQRWSDYWSQRPA